LFSAPIYWAEINQALTHPLLIALMVLR
jgi:hypothetical protein